MSLIDPQQLQRELQDLTPMPQVVHDVLAAIGTDEIGIDELAMRIGRDPALAARALRVANSVFYGAAGRIGSVRDALRLVGLRRIGAVVAASAVAGRFERPRCVGFDFDAFWLHSLATAIGAQAIAIRCGLDEGHAFTAGLLHDIGRLVLATRFPEQLAASIDDARRRDVDCYTSEAPVLGLEHAEVGAMVGAHWRFAAPVIEAIRGHHAPASAGGAPSLADVLHVADGIAHALDVAQDQHEFVPLLALEPWLRLDLDPQTCARLFGQIESAHAALREALAI